MTLFKNKIC